MSESLTEAVEGFERDRRDSSGYWMLAMEWRTGVRYLTPLGGWSPSPNRARLFASETEALEHMHPPTRDGDTTHAAMPARRDGYGGSGIHEQIDYFLHTPVRAVPSGAQARVKLCRADVHDCLTAANEQRQLAIASPKLAEQANALATRLSDLAERIAALLEEE